MSSSNLLVEAERFAREAHEGQLRKDGVPYIVHPQRVAEFLHENGFDDLTVAAGWLHDTLEDTDASASELNVLNPELVDIIQAVTEDASLPWVERKKKFSDTIRTASLSAKAVACADRIDNLMDFLVGYEREGDQFWSRWPERTPQQKVESDEYFLEALQEGWDHPIIDQLRVLIEKEQQIVNKS